MTAGTQHNLWFPSFLERMACCTLPPNKVDDLILLGDSSGGSDGIVGESGHYDDEDEIIIQSAGRQPFSQVPYHEQRLVSTGQLSQVSLILNQHHQLRSPTLSPSRRELDPWDPSCLIVPNTLCARSNAGSSATTASIWSDEDDDDHYEERVEEIRSNATTQVISHRKRYNRRNKLLSSTLASAEQRLKKQRHEEDLRSQAFKGHRAQRD